MASDQGNGSFTGQLQSHTFAGFLFDLDGTIINTTDAVTKHWHKSVHGLFPPSLFSLLERPSNFSRHLFNDSEGSRRSARRIGAELGVDHDVILRSSRGRRSIDTLALYDPSKANWECQSNSTDFSNAVLIHLHNRRSSHREPNTKIIWFFRERDTRRQTSTGIS